MNLWTISDLPITLSFISGKQLIDYLNNALANVFEKKKNVFIQLSLLKNGVQNKDGE